MSGIIETLSKARDFVAGASNYVADACESLAKSSDAFKNACLPGSPEIREKIGKMCDAGYGTHFVDAHQALVAGKSVDAGSLGILQQFGLADAHGKAA